MSEIQIQRSRIPGQGPPVIEEPKPLDDSELLSEELTIDEDEEDVELLKYTDSKNLYLTKVGLVFTIYWLIACLVLSMIYFGDDNFRRKYFNYRDTQKTWILLYIMIGVKVFMSFLGFLVRSLSTIFFLVDCYLINTFAVGLYFYLEGYHQDQYTGNGFWVVAFSYALLLGSLGFVFSAMLKDNKNVYSFVMGIVLMTLFTAGGLAACSSLFNVPNFQKTEYLIVFGIVTAYNLYFAINSYQVITFRGEKFYDDEFSYCFFCYFTDWFSFFIFDLFRSASFHRLKIRAEMMARKNLNKKKRAEARAENPPVMKNVAGQQATTIGDVEANIKNDSF